MNTQWKNVRRLTMIAMISSVIGGCAAGKWFMAGYTPPQTIADLINQQYGMAGEIPPEIDINKRKDKPISLEGNDEQHLAASTQQSVMEYYPTEAPVQRFNPRFTYKSVQDYAGQLAMSLFKNGNGLNGNARIGVSSFVKLDTSLQNTTILGNQLAEYAISEIQQFGLNVIDFKLMPALQVTSNGDIAFTRNVMELANNKIMDHVLSGTMIEKRDGVFVNARIIQLGSNRVVASASILIPRFVAEQNQAGFSRYATD